MGWTEPFTSLDNVIVNVESHGSFTETGASVDYEQILSGSGAVFTKSAVSGAPAGTITAEGSLDGTTWYPAGAAVGVGAENVLTLAPAPAPTRYLRGVVNLKGGSGGDPGSVTVDGLVAGNEDGTNWSEPDTLATSAQLTMVSSSPVIYTGPSIQLDEVSGGYGVVWSFSVVNDVIGFVLDIQGSFDNRNWYAVGASTGYGANEPNGSIPASASVLTAKEGVPARFVRAYVTLNSPGYQMNGTLTVSASLTAHA